MLRRITQQRSPLLIRCLAAFAFLLVFVSAPQKADAGLMQEITILDTGGNLFGSGRITFLTESGINNTNLIDEFSFSATVFGNEVVWDITDILAISWAIDPSDWEIDLFLSLNFAPTITPGSDIQANLLLTMFSSMGTATSACQDLTMPFACGGSGFNTATSTAVQAQSIPEPSTALMFLTGLAVLSLFGWGARRRQAAQAA